MITQEQVLQALKQVDDPDLKRDIVSLGMVKDIEIQGKQVSFTVVLTTPACPMKEMIQNACITAVKLLVSPEAEVHVTMTANVTSHTGKQIFPGIKNIIAVASGKGGVGKSTIASNLAIALAQTGSRTGLLDADIYGPSMPVMFGLEDARPLVEVVDGKNKMIPVEKYGIQINSIGFLVEKGQAIVWRGPMASNALKQLATDTLWNDLDYLIVDLPPGTGDIHITIAQGLPLTGTVIVTTPQEVALADARKGIAMFLAPAVNVPVLGVVENMSWFETNELPDRKFYLFGKDGGKHLAAEFQLPVLGQIPLVETVREAGDRGIPCALDTESNISAAFRQFAKEVARQVAIRNAKSNPN